LKARNDEGADRTGGGSSGAALGFVLALPFLLFGLFAADDALLRFFPDDAFYYLETAYRFARSGQITFDGVNPTNGFHPLYFLCCSLLALVFGKAALFRAVFIFDSLVLLAALGMIVGGFRHTTRAARDLTFVLLALFPILCFVRFSHGLEAGLVVLGTALLLRAWQRAEARGFQQLSRNLLLGGAFAAFLLARLDMIIPAAPCLAWLALFSPLRRKPLPWLRGLAGIGVIPVLLCGAYLAWNLLQFGHAVPVSGAVKHHYGLPFSWAAVTGHPLAGAAVGLFPLLTSVVALASRWAPGSGGKIASQDSPILTLLNLGVLLSYGYLFFFAANAFFWYFAYPEAVAAINIAAFAPRLFQAGSPLAPIAARRGRELVAVALAANLAFNGSVLTLISRTGSFVSCHLRKIATEIDRTAGENPTIGVFDAGIIGFFSRGRVVNLDGLANSYDYFERYCIPGRFQEYFRDQGITHLLVRDANIVNLEAVRAGRYERARFGLDKRISLPRSNELFRYTIPGGFSVFLFALGDDLPPPAAPRP